MDRQLRSDLRDVIAGLQPGALADLADLIRLESNLGREITAQQCMRDSFGTMGLSIKEVTIDLAALSSRPGFSPLAIENTDGRVNIVGIHRPREPSGGLSLIVNGHMDVVPEGPEELWRHPPFYPAVEDGWMYGRGSGDMKAGIVAYCTAFQALAELGLQPAAPVILQSVIEEESTGNGALACLEAPYRADAAIIPEPFGQNIMHAQLGVIWLQEEINGKPAHALDTSAGINAIESVYAIFDGLRQLEAHWNEPEQRHPKYAHHAHPVNFNLGKIEGGDWGSTLPSRCIADIRVGFYPGMELGQVRGALETRIREIAASDPHYRGATVEIHYRRFHAEGCVMDRQDSMMTALARAHREVFGEDCEFTASTATTNAGFFQIN